MVATTSFSTASNDAKMNKTLTTMEYDDFMAEIEGVTEQLTQTRTSLWETQDRLRASEVKVQQLEMHVEELVAVHDQDVQRIKALQQENSQCLEEEVKIRESLDLMKKVFTRLQLKSREEQETIALLQEERTLLLAENKKLRSAKSDVQNENEVQKGTNDLATALDRTQSELAEYRRKNSSLEGMVQQLKKKLLEQKAYLDPNEKVRKSKSNAIDRALAEHVQPIEGRNDSFDDFDESDIVLRAFLDEDLDDGFARNFIQNLDCGSHSDATSPKGMNCTSFGAEIATTAYPFFGFGKKPLTSM